MRGILLSSFLIIYSIINVLALSPQNVHFNGVFQNGTTLYSDSLNIDDGYIFGRDVYPIRNNTREKICEIKNRTKTERVCTNNTTEFR